MRRQVKRAEGLKSSTKEEHILKEISIEKGKRIERKKSKKNQKTVKTA